MRSPTNFIRRNPAGAMLALLIVFVVLIQLVDAKDYYKILGLERDATESQIKRAFRKLSKKFHPDLNKGDPEAHNKFVDISEANEILSNAEKRQIYDIDGIEGLKRQNQPRDPFWGGHGGGRPKGPNANVELRMSLEQLYLGAETKISIERNVICNKCRGTGAKDGETSKCNICKGKGVTMTVQTLGPGFQVQMQQPCHACGGKGTVAKNACPTCRGQKVVREKKTLLAVIERGMKDGSQIIFERESEQNPNTIPGDVIATLRETPHPRFRRDGDDLHAEVRVSLKEALLGFTKSIQHLDNRAVSVSRSGVTAPFTVIKVENEGMPHHGTPSIRGHLYVKVIVDFPDRLSDAQKESVRQLLSA